MTIYSSVLLYIHILPVSPSELTHPIPLCLSVADMKTPKMQLDVQPIKDIWNESDASTNNTKDTKDNNSNDTSTTPNSSSTHPMGSFISKLWSVRIAASRCYESFYIVEELDQLLKYHQNLLHTKVHGFHMHMNSFTMAAARSNIPPQQHEMNVYQQRMQFEKEQHMISVIIGEISKERDNAIAVLALSCGISPIENQQNQQNTGQPVQSVQSGFHVDEELFSALISTMKGKKLINSMFGYLLPAHKWSILSLVMIKILQRIETTSNTTSGSTSASGSTSSNVDLDIEMKLLNLYVGVSDRDRDCDYV